MWVQVSPAWLGSPLQAIAKPVAFPGTTIWWFTLGGPFRTVPTTLGGGLFGALANTAFWVVVTKLLVVTIRAVASRFRGK